MLLCSTVVVVLRGIDRRHSSASGPLFQPSGRTHATAAAARPGGAFLAVSWAGSLGSCDGRHGRPSLSLSRDCADRWLSWKPLPLVGMESAEEKVSE